MGKKTKKTKIILGSREWYEQTFGYEMQLAKLEAKKQEEIINAMDMPVVADDSNFGIQF